MLLASYVAEALHSFDREKHGVVTLINFYLQNVVALWLCSSAKFLEKEEKPESTSLTKVNGHTGRLVPAFYTDYCLTTLLIACRL